MLILMVYVSLFHYTGSGPNWVKEGPEVNHCEKAWYYNILYINNFFDDRENSVRNLLKLYIQIIHLLLAHENCKAPLPLYIHLEFIYLFHIQLNLPYRVDLYNKSLSMKKQLFNECKHLLIKGTFS